MAGAKELQKTRRQGEERDIMINTQEEEPDLMHPSPYDGMPSAPQPLLSVQ